MDDVTLHWKAEIAGVKWGWDAKITERCSDQRIAWTDIGGAENAGVVTFHKIDDNTTKVMLQINFDPEGIVEKTGDALGVVRARPKGDLERFKKFIEERGTETGAWRG